MLDTEDIVRIAVRETDAPPVDESYLASVKAALESPDTVPRFSASSRPLSVVRFRALLQDTGFGSEVYSPSGSLDMTDLAERWIGWGVEIPGIQPWAYGLDTADELASLSLSSESAAPALPEKHPLAALGEKGAGALLKIYDGGISYGPASVVDVIGIVGQGVLPRFDDGEGEPSLVPAIHVLSVTQLDSPHFGPAVDSSARESLVTHLASVFDPPDAAAGELLLLSLLARPERRSGVPLGALALNVVRPRPSSDGASLAAHLRPLAAAVVPLPLSLDLLHRASFRPSSTDGSSLTPGVLQLARGTLLVVDEDGLGDGGQLQPRALTNLQALSEVLQDQVLVYEYPYTGVRIETGIRGVVESEARSLLPVDATLITPPLRAGVQSPSPGDLERWRAYLLHHGSREHADEFSMPDSIATMIQDEFVAERQAGGLGREEAERSLTLRMKIARLMALSEGKEVTEAVWRRAVGLEREVGRRKRESDDRRRERNLGQPTHTMPNGVPNGVPNGTANGLPNGVPNGTHEVTPAATA